MKIEMKKIIALLIVMALSVSLCACGENALSGTYISESGVYSIEFNKDGTCTWYQDGYFFNGTYHQTDAGWKLNISGDGYYMSTTFDAEKSGKDLIITGGVVYGEVFAKK